MAWPVYYAKHGVFFVWEICFRFGTGVKVGGGVTWWDDRMRTMFHLNGELRLYPGLIRVTLHAYFAIIRRVHVFDSVLILDLHIWIHVYSQQMNGWERRRWFTRRND